MSILKDNAKSEPDEETISRADETVSANDRFAADDEQAEPQADESDAGQEELQSADEAAAAERESEASRQQVKQRADDEQSIDDYMSKLLEKYGGKMEGGAAASQSQTTEAMSRQGAAPHASRPEVSLEPPKPASAPKPAMTKLEPPRTAAPEKTVDLAAMRELANFSTRAAIATHHHRRNQLVLLGKVSVGVIGLISGALLLHWGDDEQSWIFFGGLAGLIVSGYWFVRAGHMARSLQKFRRKAENQAAATQREPRLSQVDDGGLDLSDPEADDETVAQAD